MKVVSVLEVDRNFERPTFSSADKKWITQEIKSKMHQSMYIQLTLIGNEFITDANLMYVDKNSQVWFLYFLLVIVLFTQ